MNILIVDGNEKDASDRYTDIGMLTQYDVYKKVLENLLKTKFNITIIHPACYKNYLPQGLNLQDFQGIVWTGSLLNIYDLSPSIVRQIELAKELLNKKNKMFGSCWGLQVLATAAGGKVRKNPKGLEAVFAKNIILNANGINHPMYLDKPRKFDSFCWHYDEIENLPQNSKILSSNEKSRVQSFAFKKGNSDVWAVQYHPEFDSKWIAGLMNQRKSLLLEEEIYKTDSQFNDYYSFFSDNRQYNHLKNYLSISDTLVNKKIHTIELHNWLINLMHNN